MGVVAGIHTSSLSKRANTLIYSSVAMVSSPSIKPCTNWGSQCGGVNDEGVGRRGYYPKASIAVHQVVYARGKHKLLQRSSNHL